MELPLAILLVPFALLVAIAALMLIFNIYHLGKFGLEGGKTLLLMLSYVAAFGIVLVISLTALAPTPWWTPLQQSDFFVEDPAAATFGL